MEKNDDITIKHKEMLYPTVRVRTKGVGGSGTVLYSKKDEEGKYHTFVLTNHHVIENAISVDKAYDPIIGMDRKREFREPVNVEMFYYEHQSEMKGSRGFRAYIRAYSPHQNAFDLALLELDLEENPIEYVANIFPHEVSKNIRVYDDVWAVGASLGHHPIITDGHIVSKNDMIQGYKYWMSTAQTIFGNSGGSLYRYSESRNQHEFVGVPSMISVAQIGFSASPITHMGYVIPIESVIKFLDDNGYEFIYDKSKSYEECEIARKKKIEERRKLILAKFGGAAER